MNKKRGIGLILLLIGLIVIFSEPVDLTGYVIEGSGAARDIQFYFGLISVIAGILFLAEAEERVPIRFIKTAGFEKASRKHSKSAINRAIAKIGTGAGKEERLKHVPGHSIRVSGGARIIFDYRDRGRTVVLTDYLPAHEYPAP